jgi:uncharacterized protein (TIGR03083 family)
MAYDPPMSVPPSLQASSEQFRELAHRIGDGDWERTTPCADWTVRQLVGHVVAGSVMTAALLRRATRQEAIAILGVDHLGDHPLVAVDAALDEQLVAEVWAFMQPMAPMVASFGVFGEGPSGDVGDDAPLDRRLLDLSGRRP